jgi:ABC-type amino acid transport substrate-binding protein
MSNAPEQLPDESKQKPRIWLYVLLGCLTLLLLTDVAFRGLQMLFFNRSTPSPTSAVDESWAVVQRTGVLLVGTSSGYPPFAFYTSNRNLDGFDIALAYEIGKKLGVQVNIQDIPFNNLFSALSNSQIDAAMAAISITADRERQMAFSNVYYVGSDGILAQKGSPITSVKTPQDMANKRIGVQKDTVYQTWVQNTLVDPGLISASQMFVFATAADAVNDLSLGRLDLVILDLQPAIASTSKFNVVLVGEGLDLQRMAVAMKTGSVELTGKINDALLQLQNEGVLAALQNEYLGLTPSETLPISTATPAPAASATRVPTVPITPYPPYPPYPPPGCVNSMQYIKDLTYDDGGMSYYADVKIKQHFSKGWRIKNIGSCTWNSSYYVKFVHGTQMSGQPTAIEGKVYPGHTYDLYVDLVAPSTVGKYKAEWRMFNPYNYTFGDSLWVMIEAIPAATPTVTRTRTITSTAASTSTASPSATLTSTPTPTPTPTSTPTPTAT